MGQAPPHPTGPAMGYEMCASLWRRSWRPAARLARPLARHARRATRCRSKPSHGSTRSEAPSRGHRHVTPHALALSTFTKRTLPRRRARAAARRATLCARAAALPATLCARAAARQATRRARPAARPATRRTQPPCGVHCVHKCAEAKSRLHQHQLIRSRHFSWRCKHGQRQQLRHRHRRRPPPSMRLPLAPLLGMVRPLHHIRARHHRRRRLRQRRLRKRLCTRRRPRRRQSRVRGQRSGRTLAVVRQVPLVRSFCGRSRR